MSEEKQPVWPVIDGAYVVGDPVAPVAVCALTSESLVAPLAQSPGVAIAGQVYTANLGLERIVVNVTANPSIRFLLLCGKDSKLFPPGQSLAALVDNGVDEAGRIVGGEGYDPVLPTVPPTQVDVFRRQIELIEHTGEEDVATLQAHVSEAAARDPGRFTEQVQDTGALPVRSEERARFVSISPGGKREPLQYDPKGYFVITLDREEEQIVLRHYLPDHAPAHEMRGRVGASMFLGLVREGLVSQLSHAGYLGAELAKAEVALRLGLRYDQDRPVRRPPQPADTNDRAAAPPMPRITPPFTWDQLSSTQVGDKVSVVLEVTDRPSGTALSGAFLEPTEKDPFSAFCRTSHRLDAFTTNETKTVMGEPSDVVAGAILRLSGLLQPDRRVEAQAVVILTNVASVR